ncbi:MAG: HNH endonuclease domain-containing protein [Ferruginibacter sp.]
MHLPKSKTLPINLLAACFNNTSATYKYYWLLSIIQSVEEENLTISKLHLFSRMISNAWYTVNYFHVSFGKQDLIQQVIIQINKLENISIDENQQIVFRKISSTKKLETLNQLWHFNNNVPHWFLSPWFTGMKRKQIYDASIGFNNECLYELHNDKILINPAWKSYLIENARVLKDFCYWNLSLFLQSKNPNVPDIPSKLIKPAKRNGLSMQRTQYWDIVLRELGHVQCIYTGKKLTVGNYAVEHFIPYNFVSHDLIWNLIPANISFNNTKSDKLPPLNKYFDSFFELQKLAVGIIKIKKPESKLLEDYYTVFPDLETSFTKEKFRERIQPLVTIASNNGFEFL